MTPTRVAVEQSTDQTRQLRPYRPPMGIPAGRENARVGLAVSVALHTLIAALLLVPFAQHVVVPIIEGAGGPGPAGGGGGGRGGTGGAARPVSSERLSFIQVAPEAPPKAQPAVTPPPQPVVPPKPVETPRPVPLPADPKPDTSVSTKAAPTPDVAATPGAGGGSGTDGTTGSGPGSGGGVGTGVGTGRGSGVGPGTGGGAGVNYPPSPIDMFLPPLPVPDRLKGTRVVAEFDIDETGRVLSFTFTETRDGGYNKRLRQVLREIKFRPGSRPDGTPIRMKAQIEYTLSG